MTNNQQKPFKKLDYQYTGEHEASKGTKDPQGRTYDPYIPSDDLIEAVNLAIALERPLLLEGEPGCGKTLLAGAVACEFTQKYLKDENSKQKWWDYYIWNIKSTTRARDGLYRYDAVARLRDAQLMGTDLDKLKEFIGDDETRKLKTRLKDKKKYRTFEPLGKALGAGEDHKYRPILLIDEIDKADSDFANDLLLELEELRFEVPETGETFSIPEKKPIIFITSNREKPLPEPFLRRCIYFDVEFPDTERLKKIVKKRFTLEDNQRELVQKAISNFYEIRELLDNNPGSRPPGTSEFIDFLTAILKRDALEDLENLFDGTPLLGILIKTKQDRDLIKDNQQKLRP